jgi:hypothetical protein
VVEELGPFEEAAACDRRLEGGTVDEDIGAPFQFSWPRRSGGPTAAQPQGGIVSDEVRSDGALAGPAGTDEDEDARLARVGFSAQSL